MCLDKDDVADFCFMRGEVIKMLNELFKGFNFNEKTDFHINEVNSLKLPNDYLEFMSLHDGGEGPVGEYGYARIFSLEELEEMNDEYDVKNNWPGYIVFGSDMGGMLLAYNPEKEIYCEIDSCNTGEDTYFTICNSLEEFFVAFDEESKE